MKLVHVYLVALVFMHSFIPSLSYTFLTSFSTEFPEPLGEGIYRNKLYMAESSRALIKFIMYGCGCLLPSAAEERVSEND